MLTDPRSPLMLARRIANRIGRPLGINPFPRAFENPLSTDKRSPEDIFDEIYKENYWGSIESRSGVGSEVEATSQYKVGLSELLHTRRLRRVFDAPSGDLNWIVGLIEGTGIEYSGGDISAEVVGSARRRHPNVNLTVFDITKDTFPQADVWHCRDCLFHLPFASVSHALENFAKSSIPFVLATSHRGSLLHRNLDVGYGGFRFLDLQRPPFSLPRPIARIPDYLMGRDFPRYVCLWSRQQIADALTTIKL